MTNITQFPLNAVAYMRQNERRQISARPTTTHRQPPASCRETLRRAAPEFQTGNYVMHTGTRFSGQVGHIIDMDISTATRSVTRYLVSFSGLRTWLRADEMRKVTRVHQTVSDVLRGA